MLYYLREVELPHIIVATKTDKLNATEKNKFLEIIAEEELTRDLPLVMYSSKTNLGRVDLWNQIYSACEV
jgi:GTP-binding protein EngB required for normal cell division